LNSDARLALLALQCGALCGRVPAIYGSYETSTI
jgi:hypothetical protein